MQKILNGNFLNEGLTFKSKKANGEEVLFIMGKNEYIEKMKKRS